MNSDKNLSDTVDNLPQDISLSAAVTESNKQDNYNEQPKPVINDNGVNSNTAYASTNNKNNPINNIDTVNPVNTEEADMYKGQAVESVWNTAQNYTHAQRNLTDVRYAAAAKLFLNPVAAEKAINTSKASRAKLEELNRKPLSETGLKKQLVSVGYGADDFNVIDPNTGKTYTARGLNFDSGEMSKEDRDKKSLSARVDELYNVAKAYGVRADQVTDEMKNNYARYQRQNVVNYLNGTFEVFDKNKVYEELDPTKINEFQLDVVERGVDRYGRPLVELYRNGRSINKALAAMPSINNDYADYMKYRESTLKYENIVNAVQNAFATKDYSFTYDIDKSTWSDAVDRMQAALRGSAFRFSAIINDIIGTEGSGLTDWFSTAYGIPVDNIEYLARKDEILRGYSGASDYHNDNYVRDMGEIQEAVEDGDYGKATLLAIRNLPFVLADSAATLAPFVVSIINPVAGLVVAAVTAVDLVKEMELQHKVNNEGKGYGFFEFLGYTALYTATMAPGIAAGALLKMIPKPVLMPNSQHLAWLEKIVGATQRASIAAGGVALGAGSEYIEERLQTALEMWGSQPDDAGISYGEMFDSIEARTAGLLGAVAGGAIAVVPSTTKAVSGTYAKYKDRKRAEQSKYIRYDGQGKLSEEERADVDTKLGDMAAFVDKDNLTNEEIAKANTLLNELDAIVDSGKFSEEQSWYITMYASKAKNSVVKDRLKTIEEKMQEKKPQGSRDTDDKYDTLSRNSYYRAALGKANDQQAAVIIEQMAEIGIRYDSDKVERLNKYILKNIYKGNKEDFKEDVVADLKEQGVEAAFANELTTDLFKRQGAIGFHSLMSLLMQAEKESKENPKDTFLQAHVTALKSAMRAELEESMFFFSNAVNYDDTSVIVKESDGKYTAKLVNDMDGTSSFTISKEEVDAIAAKEASDDFKLNSDGHIVVDKKKLLRHLLGADTVKADKTRLDVLSEHAQYLLRQIAKTTKILGEPSSYSNIAQMALLLSFVNREDVETYNKVQRGEIDESKLDSNTQQTIKEIAQLRAIFIEIVQQTKNVYGDLFDDLIIDQDIFNIIDFSDNDSVADIKNDIAELLAEAAQQTKANNEGLNDKQQARLVATLDFTIQRLYRLTREVQLSDLDSMINDLIKLVEYLPSNVLVTGLLQDLEYLASNLKLFKITDTTTSNTNKDKKIAETTTKLSKKIADVKEHRKKLYENAQKQKQKQEQKQKQQEQQQEQKPQEQEQTKILDAQNKPDKTAIELEQQDLGVKEADLTEDIQDESEGSMVTSGSAIDDSTKEMPTLSKWSRIVDGTADFLNWLGLSKHGGMDIVKSALKNILSIADYVSIERALSTADSGFTENDTTKLLKIAYLLQAYKQLKPVIEALQQNLKQKQEQRTGTDLTEEAKTAEEQLKNAIEALNEIATKTRQKAYEQYNSLSSLDKAFVLEFFTTHVKNQRKYEQRKKDNIKAKLTKVHTYYKVFGKIFKLKDKAEKAKAKELPNISEQVEERVKQWNTEGTDLNAVAEQLGCTIEELKDFMNVWERKERIFLNHEAAVDIDRAELHLKSSKINKTVIDALSGSSTYDSKDIQEIIETIPDDIDEKMLEQIIETRFKKLSELSLTNTAVESFLFNYTNTVVSMKHSVSGDIPFLVFDGQRAASILAFLDSSENALQYLERIERTEVSTDTDTDTDTDEKDNTKNSLVRIKQDAQAIVYATIKAFLPNLFSLLKEDYTLDLSVLANDNEKFLKMFINIKALDNDEKAKNALKTLQDMYKNNKALPDSQRTVVDKAIKKYLAKHFKAKELLALIHTIYQVNQQNLAAFRQISASSTFLQNLYGLNRDASPDLINAYMANAGDMGIPIDRLVYNVGSLYLDTLGLSYDSNNFLYTATDASTLQGQLGAVVLQAFSNLTIDGTQYTIVEINHAELNKLYTDNPNALSGLLIEETLNKLEDYKNANKVEKNAIKAAYMTIIAHHTAGNPEEQLKQGTFKYFIPSQTKQERTVLTPKIDGDSLKYLSDAMSISMFSDRYTISFLPHKASKTSKRNNGLELSNFDHTVMQRHNDTAYVLHISDDLAEALAKAAVESSTDENSEEKVSGFVYYLGLPEVDGSRTTDDTLSDNGKTLSISNHFSLIKDLLPLRDVPFYMRWEGSRNLRSTLISSTINPQSFKFDRFFLTRAEDAYFRTIDFNDEIAVDNFKYAVLQAFGLKPENMTKEKINTQFEEIINDIKDHDDVKASKSFEKAVISHIESRTLETFLKSLTDQDYDVASIKNHFAQLLKAANAIDNYTKAKESKAASFESDVNIEYDSKTSGTYIEGMKQGLFSSKPKEIIKQAIDNLSKEIEVLEQNSTDNQKEIEAKVNELSDLLQHIFITKHSFLDGDTIQDIKDMINDYNSKHKVHVTEPLVYEHRKQYDIEKLLTPKEDSKEDNKALLQMYQKDIVAILTKLNESKDLKDTESLIKKLEGKYNDLKQTAIAYGVNEEFITLYAIQNMYQMATTRGFNYAFVKQTFSRVFEESDYDDYVNQAEKFVEQQNYAKSDGGHKNLRYYTDLFSLDVGSIIYDKFSFKRSSGNVESNKKSNDKNKENNKENNKDNKEKEDINKRYHELLDVFDMYKLTYRTGYTLIYGDKTNFINLFSETNKQSSIEEILNRTGVTLDGKVKNEEDVYIDILEKTFQAKNVANDIYNDLCFADIKSTDIKNTDTENTDKSVDIASLLLATAFGYKVDIDIKEQVQVLRNLAKQGIMTFNYMASMGSIKLSLEEVITRKLLEKLTPILEQGMKYAILLKLHKTVVRQDPKISPPTKGIYVKQLLKENKELIIQNPLFGLVKNLALINNPVLFDTSDSKYDDKLTDEAFSLLLSMSSLLDSKSATSVQANVQTIFAEHKGFAKDPIEISTANKRFNEKLPNSNNSFSGLIHKALAPVFSESYGTSLQSDLSLIKQDMLLLKEGMDLIGGIYEYLTTIAIQERIKEEQAVNGLSTYELNKIYKEYEGIAPVYSSITGSAYTSQTLEYRLASQTANLPYAHLENTEVVGEQFNLKQSDLSFNNNGVAPMYKDGENNKSLIMFPIKTLDSKGNIRTSNIQAVVPVLAPAYASGVVFSIHSFDGGTIRTVANDMYEMGFGIPLTIHDAIVVNPHFGLFASSLYNYTSAKYAYTDNTINQVITKLENAIELVEKEIKTRRPFSKKGSTNEESTNISTKGEGSKLVLNAAVKAGQVQSTRDAIVDAYVEENQEQRFLDNCRRVVADLKKQAVVLGLSRDLEKQPNTKININNMKSYGDASAIDLSFDENNTAPIKPEDFLRDKLSKRARNYLVEKQKEKNRAKEKPYTTVYGDVDSDRLTMSLGDIYGSSFKDIYSNMIGTQDDKQNSSNSNNSTSSNNTDNTDSKIISDNQYMYDDANFSNRKTVLDFNEGDADVIVLYDADKDSTLSLEEVMRRLMEATGESETEVSKNAKELLKLIDKNLIPHFKILLKIEKKIADTVISAANTTIAVPKDSTDSIAIDTTKTTVRFYYNPVYEGSMIEDLSPSGIFMHELIHALFDLPLELSGQLNFTEELKDILQIRKDILKTIDKLPHKGLELFLVADSFDTATEADIKQAQEKLDFLKGKAKKHVYTDTQLAAEMVAYAMTQPKFAKWLKENHIERETTKSKKEVENTPADRSFIGRIFTAIGNLLNKLFKGVHLDVFGENVSKLMQGETTTVRYNAHDKMFRYLKQIQTIRTNAINRSSSGLINNINDVVADMTEKILGTVNNKSADWITEVLDTYDRIVTGRQETTGIYAYLIPELPSKDTILHNGIYLTKVFALMMLSRDFRTNLPVALRLIGIDYDGFLQREIYDFFGGRKDIDSFNLEEFLMQGRQVDNICNSAEGAVYDIAYNAMRTEKDPVNVQDFFNKKFTRKQREALTKTVLSTDIQTLLTKGYTIDDIKNMLNNTNDRNDKIKQLKETIANIVTVLVDEQHISSDRKRKEILAEVTNYYVSQCLALATFMATGKAHEATTYNAYNIATGAAFLAYKDKILSEGVKNSWKYSVLEDIFNSTTSNKKLIDAIDEITTLMSMNELSADVLAEVQQVSTKDLQVLVGISSALVSRSDEIITKENKIKGYYRKVLNHDIETKIAKISDEAALKEEGYVKVTIDNQKQLDAYGLALYKRKALVSRTRKGAAIQYFSMHATGVSIDTVNYNVMNTDTTNKTNLSEKSSKLASNLSRARHHIIQSMFKGTYSKEVVDGYSAGYSFTGVFDPTRDGGILQEFKITFTHNDYNNVFEQDNDIIRNLGMTNRNIMLKQVGIDRNTKLVGYLFNVFKEKAQNDNIFYDERLKAYRDTDGNFYKPFDASSLNPEHLALFNKLPPQTRRLMEAYVQAVNSAREAKGVNKNETDALPFLIREDWIPLIIGVENASLIDIDFINKHSNYTAKRIIVLAEQILKIIGSIAKVVIVVKNPQVLFANIVSNFTLALIRGENPVKVLKHYYKNTRDLSSYIKTKQQLAAIDLRLHSALEDKESLMLDKQNLKHLLVTNPLHELMEAGMYTNVVEDIFPTDQSALGKTLKRFEKQIDKIPLTAKQIARNIFMTQNSIGYSILYKATQYSDFVARATDYQLDLARKPKDISMTEYKKKLLRDVMERYVEYDKPQSKQIQYLNDLGFLMFTKYYKRIQRIIGATFIKHPAYATAYLTSQATLTDTSDIFDSVFFLKSLGSLVHSPLENVKTIITPPIFNML